MQDTGMNLPPPSKRIDNEEEEESRSLKFLIGDVVGFFDRTFQVSCAVFQFPTTTTTITDAAAGCVSTTPVHTNESVSVYSNSNENIFPWDQEKAESNPLQELIQMGWYVLIELLEQRHRTLLCGAIQDDKTATISDDIDDESNDNNNYDEIMRPLLFRNCMIISTDEARAKYSFLNVTSLTDTIDQHNNLEPTRTSATSTSRTSTTTTTSSSNYGSMHDPSTNRTVIDINLWASYLDGCSIVLNHCDRSSPWIAALCQDIQRSVPHAYANAYITPPNAQAVPAHADDRDVFIVQVYGRKHWYVYEQIPIPYPYPKEQVGKDHMDVPERVTQGVLLLDQILEPGQVLYMPRGYVHEARAVSDCCSFHVTVAMATHDWTMAGLLSNAASCIWRSHIPFRMAMDRAIGRKTILDVPTRTKVQNQITTALEMLQAEFTIPNIEMALRNKYRRHNQRATMVRNALMMAYTVNHSTSTMVRNQNNHTSINNGKVGYRAATTVTLQSWLRVATEMEKQSLRNDHTTTTVGLHVRDENYTGIFGLLQYYQQQQQQQQQGNKTPVAQRLDEAAEAVFVKNDDDCYACICKLTILSFAKRCVELGALAVLQIPPYNHTEQNEK